MADRFWIASSASDWNDTSNWSTSSGGSGGASVPGGSDKAIFDGASTEDCSFDIAPTVADFEVHPGYTGIISTGGNNLTVDGSLVLDDGTFDAADSTIQVAGNCVIANAEGVLVAEAATLDFAGTGFIANPHPSNAIGLLLLCAASQFNDLAEDVAPARSSWAPARSAPAPRPRR